MLKSYLKVAFRGLAKNKIYTFINVFGLAIAFTATLLIYLFVRNELRFDDFHPKKVRIYRLNEVQSFEGITPQKVALSMYPMGPTLRDEFPEIIDFTRVTGAGRLIRHEDKRILLDQTLWVDGSFLEIFDFEMISGERSAALQEPNSVVLTETTARKLLETTAGLGKTILRDTVSYKVTGILKDIPDHSHLQFDALYSISSRDDERLMQNWGNNWLTTYLELAEGPDVTALEAKFPAYLDKYMSARNRGGYQLYLQALSDVHLGSMEVTHDYLNWRKFDRTYVRVFSILAVFVLVIACINFMNISTARAANRAKEVGIRKSVGAFRGQVAKQFIGESVMLALLAIGLALVMTKLLLPMLNALSQRDLRFDLLQDFTFLPGILLFASVIGILAGIYPAVFLSSFTPVRALKGASESDGRKTRLRSALVVVQFAMAFALVVGSGVAAKQLNFMRFRNNGINQNQVMLLPMSNQANEKYDLIKQRYRAERGVVDVTASGQRLGNNLHQWGLKAASGDTVRQLAPSNLHVDYNYISFYGLDLTLGREFSEDFSTDRRNAYVVNESFVREVGWNSPLGKEIGLSGRDSLGAVIGVVRDFNFNSLHHKIQPLVLSVQDWGFNEMSVRIATENIQKTIGSLEAIWNEMVPDYPFQYSFLDDHFARLYQADKQVTQVIGSVASLSVVIACLGLFGLASIATAQRTKEIGVRKVLGASLTGIVVLLSKGFARLLLIAFVVATPVIYLVMKGWLQDFAYRVEIGFEVFVYAGVLSMAIAVITVSYHAIRTATANPVKALRYE